MQIYHIFTPKGLKFQKKTNKKDCRFDCHKILKELTGTVPQKNLIPRDQKWSVRKPCYNTSVNFWDIDLKLLMMYIATFWSLFDIIMYSLKMFLQVRLNLQSLLRFKIFQQRYLKNGKTDLENSTTFHIANSILYNFYFMQIYYIFTFEGLKLQKTIFGQSSGRYGSNFLRISRSFYESLRQIQFSITFILCKYTIFLLFRVLNCKKNYFWTILGQGRSGSKSYFLA